MLTAVLLAVAGVWSPAEGRLGLVPVACQILLLPLRRRFPGWVLGGIAAATVVQVSTEPPRNLACLPVLLALYAAPGSARTVVRWWLCGLATVSVAATTIVAKSPLDGVLVAMICVVAWVIGIQRQRHIAERAEFAAQRARYRLERVVTEQRERTARRLHDTLARTTTVMLVQAEALRIAGDLSEPDRDRVDRLLAAGRDALAQVRETLGELRGDGEPDPEPELTVILAQLSASGLVLEHVPDWSRIPAGVRDLADRFVAEAATNALRHNGPGVRLRFDVEVAADSVRITARNDRRASAPVGRGYGLAGLREQFDARGGILAVEPTVREWTVTAIIPSVAVRGVVTR